MLHERIDGRQAGSRANVDAAEVKISGSSQVGVGGRVLAGDCGLGLGWCCWHFVKRVRVPAASKVPVMGTRRRFTPEYRRNAPSLVLDMGATIASVARD